MLIFALIHVFQHSPLVNSLMLKACSVRPALTFLQTPRKGPSSIDQDDIIFDLAYPEETCSEAFISRTLWEARQCAMKRNDREYVVQPFPQSAINQLMVSKKWFGSAAKAWVKNQHFRLRFGHLGGTVRMDTSDAPLSARVVLAFVERLEILRITSFPFWPLPALKTVTVTIHAGTFKCLEPVKHV
jgi:hypothetical protein